MNDVSPLRRLLSLALAGTLVYVAALGLVRLPCWALLGLAVPVAWPIWAYQAGNALFARRLWLMGVTREHSALRRWFFRGWLVQAVGAVFALGLAGVLLPLAALLGPEHWAVLALDVLLLSLAVGPLQRRLARDVAADKVAFVARRWPLMALNLALLGGAFLILDFAVSTTADTRGLPWHRVAEGAFQQTAALAHCVAAGWLTGVLAAAQALTWHASQLVIPNLPDPALKLAAWGLLLAKAGLLAWLFTRVLLGTLALVEQRRGPTEVCGPAAGGGTASTAFVYTILLLAVPYLYAVQKLLDFDPAVLERQARAVVVWSNPCRADPAPAALSRQLDERLVQLRRDAIAAGERRIDGDLDALFGRVERGVDDYLDWYFTVIGEYERLAALAVGDFGALMTSELNERLFAKTGLHASLRQLTTGLEADTDERMTRLAADLGTAIEQAASDHPCVVEVVALEGRGALANLQWDAGQAGVAAGSGAAAAAMTAKLLADKAAGALTAKLAAKKSLQSAAALGAKAAAKKGGSVLVSALGGAAVCSPSGPWALLCGIGAGAAAWLAVDKAMIEIDEVRFRQAMRADLLEGVAEQRALLAAALKEQQRLTIEAGLGALEARLGRRFLPRRDGL